MMVVASAPCSVPLFPGIYGIAILEDLIPHFRVIHLPNPKYALSAYEHSMLVNAAREFLPPETAIFRDLNGTLAGLYIPSGEGYVEPDDA